MEGPKKKPKIENFGLKVCSLGPQGDPHMRPRGNLQLDLEATRTDLEAGCNDRKRAIPQPRKQRRISLHKFLHLCFLWCSIARFLSLRPASRFVRVASRYHCGLPRGVCGLPRGPLPGCLEVSSRVSSRSNRGLPRGLMCGSPRGPREQTLRPKFSILGVFWPIRPKRTLPHPINIHNMRFGR